MHKYYKEKLFAGIAIMFILLGAIVFTIGAVTWFYNMIIGSNSIITFPGFKAISGLLIIGIGYIILELELIRLK